MACRLPGADNLDEFWRLLIEGRSAVAELPADRLDQELYYDSKAVCDGYVSITPIHFQMTNESYFTRLEEIFDGG